MTGIDLLDIKRGTVTAPAGCGKTHLIAEATTKAKPGKPILVLTHTNAGVAALRGRLEKAGVPTKAYRLSTIDGWAMRLVATFPKRADCDPKILKLENPRTEPLADWDTMVCKHFPLVGELSTPWRWKNVDEEAFGDWLLEARKQLLAGKAIDLKSAHANVSWIKTGGKDDHERRLEACRTKPPNMGGSVLIIGDSKSPQGQRQFASQTPGATTVESVDLRDLVNFARTLNLKSKDALDRVVSFAEDVMTNLGGATLLKRVETIKAAKNRKPASPLEDSALRFSDNPTYAGVRELLGAMGEQAGVRSHRPGILRGCIRALQMAEAQGGPSFQEAAVTVREQSRALGRPLPRRAVGSTLLLKGLEADVSIILNAADLNRQNLYVAMTRGSRRLVICSNSNLLKPT